MNQWIRLIIDRWIDSARKQLIAINNIANKIQYILFLFIVPLIIFIVFFIVFLIEQLIAINC
jgi:hypothetical protein